MKQHYDLCTRNYRGNKQKAVEWATRFTENNKSVFREPALKGSARTLRRPRVYDRARRTIIKHEVM